MSILDLNRPDTPQSPSANSLYDATTTIDDITTALANFSRVPSPEPPSAIVCCCRKEDCENLKSWLTLKSRLGSRLVLSAEVGQALLQRHEAYVRQHERKWNQISTLLSSQHQDNPTTDTQSTNENLDLELETLTKEKARLERLLNQALVNSEVTEVSNKTILQELHDARATITRLTAHHARSIGWDTRLSAAMKERDDMQQERDAETHRARLAESRFAVLKDKTAKLQTEVHRLQESLEEKRLSRLESSENILQGARSRIQSFRDLQLGLTVKAEQDELTNVLDSLVNDNEILKGDNAELQHLLAESREDLHELQERLEEQRANIYPETPYSKPQHLPPSSSHTESKLIRRKPRSQHFDPRLNYHIQIPDTPHSSIFFSTTDPPTPGRSSLHSLVSYELDENDFESSEVERPKARRPLLLLNRSRGTQTETWSGLLPPSPLPLPSQLSSTSPHDPRSESSSFSDSSTSQVSTILERVVALLNRMSQADALTLTNRLKRQNLKGADVAHLSRTTVGHIVSEATGLRTQFRSLLEDDRMVLVCTRKDMRLLFKFVKDVFTEMSQMRVTLNDVILDPSTANRVSEMALNPGKADTEARERELSAQSVAAGWMAPISKLFTPTVRTDATPVDRRATVVPSTNIRRPSRPPRYIHKLGPALAASAMTVNVEFSGTGRSVTSSTFSSDYLHTQTDSHVDPASDVMDIFAGAPRSHVELDPWIMVPPGQKPLRKTRSFRKIQKDVEEESDIVPPLLKRKLRRRGLSDSSIHSSFSSQVNVTPSPHVPIPSVWPDRNSVMQALSRTVQNIRATAVGSIAPLKGPIGVEDGSETPTPPPRQKSAILAPVVDHAAKPDHRADSLSPNRSQTPPPSTNTKIAQPKPIRLSRSNEGGGEGRGRGQFPGWKRMSSNNVLFDYVSPRSLDSFAGSLRDESRMTLGGRVRDHAPDFF